MGIAVAGPPVLNGISRDEPQVQRLVCPSAEVWGHMGFKRGKGTGEGYMGYILTPGINGVLGGHLPDSFRRSTPT